MDVGSAETVDARCSVPEADTSLTSELDTDRVGLPKGVSPWVDVGSPLMLEVFSPTTVVVDSPLNVVVENPIDAEAGGSLALKPGDELVGMPERPDSVEVAVGKIVRVCCVLVESVRDPLGEVVGSITLDD